MLGQLPLHFGGGPTTSKHVSSCCVPVKKKCFVLCVLILQNIESNFTIYENWCSIRALAPNFAVCVFRLTYNHKSPVSVSSSRPPDRVNDVKGELYTSRTPNCNGDLSPKLSAQIRTKMNVFVYYYLKYTPKACE